MKPTINDALKKLSEISQSNKEIIAGLDGLQKSTIEILLSKVNLNENNEIKESIVSTEDKSKNDLVSEQLKDNNSLISKLSKKYDVSSQIKNKVKKGTGNLIQNGLNSSESGKNLLNTFNQTKNFISSAKSNLNDLLELNSKKSDIESEKDDLANENNREEDLENQKEMVDKLSEISDKLSASEKTNKKILEKEGNGKNGLGLQEVAIASILARKFGKAGLIGGILSSGGSLLEATILGDMLGDGGKEPTNKDTKKNKKSKKRFGRRGSFSRLIKNGVTKLSTGFKGVKSGKIANVAKSVGKKGVSVASKLAPMAARVGALPATIITTGALAYGDLIANKGESTEISDTINKLTFGRDIKGGSKNTLGGWIYDVFNKKDENKKLFKNPPNFVINKPKIKDTNTTPIDTPKTNLIGTKKDNLRSLLNDDLFMNNLNKTAKERGVSQKDILTMFNYESGNLDPSVVNEIGYKGLFQLGKKSFSNKKLGSALKKQGFDYKNFENETPARQMEAYNIYLKYWQGVKGKDSIKSLDDIMAVQLAPARVNKNYLYKKGQNGYKYNKPLDINKDDVITKSEFSQKARDRFNENDYNYIDTKVNQKSKISMDNIKNEKQTPIIVPINQPLPSKSPTGNNTIDTSNKMGSVRNLSPYVNAIINKNLGHTL